MGQDISFSIVSNFGALYIIIALLVIFDNISMLDFPMHFIIETNLLILIQSFLNLVIPPTTRLTITRNEFVRLF
jgi:hypothetical protein